MSTELNQASALSDERFSAQAVIARLKEVLTVSTDAALAQALNVSPQTISKWRTRNSVPYPEAVFISFIRQVSLDYLLSGERSETDKIKRPAKLDAEIVRASLLSLHAFGLFDIPNTREPKQTLGDMAKAIVFQYARAEDVIHELVANKGLSDDAARSAAIVATELIGTDGSVFGRKGR